LQFGSLTLLAIATPGHTPGSTCYYLYRNGKHIRFSGDIALRNARHEWMANEVELVRTIVARRTSGGKIDWIDPFPGTGGRGLRIRRRSEVRGKI
jgi:glyoxylase-like metal-dependent hydrolase (beta-lactamase superfamily II)